MKWEYMSNKIKVALAGNPNSGKTTLFNALTGSRQHVGNYPGVTVERKETKCKYNGIEITVVDLPGIYSLTPYSIEELVARNFIFQEKPDVIIDVIDSSNLERNLYLAIQFIELDVPLLLVFNMIDEAISKGYHIDIKLLSRLLNTPVVTTVASKGEGIDDIFKTVVALAGNRNQASSSIIKYGKEIDSQINILSDYLLNKNIMNGKYAFKWLAIKLLEEDSEIIQEINKNCDNSEEILSLSSKCRDYLQSFFGEKPERIIGDKRYGFINGLCKETVYLAQEDRISTSEKIDSVLTNRILGIPIFILFMWIVFQLTFTLGNPPMRLIEFCIGALGRFIAFFMNDGILRSLIVDGVIGGVGGVLVFLPNILLLFLALAVLEDTGYMARVAFIVDKLMHFIGLHGKSFIPLLIGFGCSVPAILGTRTIENRKDRIITILVVPFMSCGARLPVYTLLIGAFFSSAVAGNVLFSIYITGFLLAILMAGIFKKFLFPGESTPFVMELPPYRIPTLKSVIIHMWEHTWLYLQKAGTILLSLSILIWFLTNFPQNITYSKDYENNIKSARENFVINMEPLAQKLNVSIEDIDKNEDIKKIIENLKTLKQSEDAVKQGELLKYQYGELYNLSVNYMELQNYIAGQMEEKQREKLGVSYAGRMGKVLEPFISPLGFDWKIGVALFSGFAAKEVIVSTLGTIYSLEEADENSISLREALKKDKIFSPLVAYTLMIFILIYSPCIATIVVVWKETNSYFWPLFMIFYTICLAWILAFFIYQGGRLLGLN